MVCFAVASPRANSQRYGGYPCTRQAMRCTGISTSTRSSATAQACTLHTPAHTSSRNANRYWPCVWVRYPTLNTKLVSGGSAGADPPLQSSIDMYKGFVRVSFFFLPLFVIKTKLLSVYHHPYYGIDHLWPGLAPAIYTSISDSRTPCPCHGIRDVFFICPKDGIRDVL